MKCKSIMNDFLELDKYQRLSLHITLHLLVCKKCRTNIRILTLAEKTNAQSLSQNIPTDDEFVQKILANVPLIYTKEDKPVAVSLKNWVIAGIIMIFALLFFPIFSYIRLPDSELLTIAFYLLFSCTIVIYCALFVGGNLDFFIKQIELAKKSQQS